MPAFIPCRACGARIFFAPTTSGKQVPLDAEPAANGNYHLGDDGVASVVPKSAQVAVGTSLYISHFATCSDSARFRKKRA